MNKPGYLFICHASTDATLASRVCEFLESRGTPCWISSRDIRMGSNYAQAILEAINGSAAILIIVSKGANDSPHVANEIERAFNRKLSLLPFRIDKHPLSDILEFFLSASQFLTVTNGSPEAYFQQLHEQCRYLMQAEGPRFTPVPVPIKGKNKHFYPAALIIAIFVAVAILAFFSIPRTSSPTTQAGDHPRQPARQDSTPDIPPTVRDSTKKPNNPSTSSLHTPEVLLALDGARYIDGPSEADKSSETEIRLSGTQGNEIGFYWKQEIYDISGKMTLKGSTLVIVSGDATGSLSIGGQGAKLKGNLTVKSSGASYPIDLTRVNAQ